MVPCISSTLSLDSSKKRGGEMERSYLFVFRMRAAINEMLPCNGVIIKESRDGSGRGAALVAAVANC